MSDNPPAVHNVPFLIEFASKFPPKVHPHYDWCQQKLQQTWLGMCRPNIFQLIKQIFSKIKREFKKKINLLPWVETARDLARSILLPTKMQAFDLNKSISCRIFKSSSALLNDALSTTE